MYEINKIPDDAPIQFEQLGTKSKFWFLNDRGQRVLFKQGRPGTGENWAEKACCEICALLDLPHAHYELARWKGQNGVISPTFVNKGFRLVLGNEILAGVEGYESEKTYRVRGHTVRLVLTVTGNVEVQMPPNCTVPNEFTLASDFFVGYLMLDALVGNQDRHHENWGLMIGPEAGLYLAPTFDHAASLGRNESDEARKDRLTTADKGRSVEVFVTRAKSVLYKSPKSEKPLSTLEAFIEAARFRKTAAQYWLKKLAEVSFLDIEEVFSNIPVSEASEEAKVFALKMLQLNTKRLLDTEV
ncbi:MAG: phosphatidylinositol kinase [Gammaproteobacteria bacterium]|nr:phosphatidylinositol kinase [Gammaproteobacteria bacterium]